MQGITLRRNYRTQTRPDGPNSWFTTSWWAIIGIHGAISYNLWSGESEEEMVLRVLTDSFSDVYPIKRVRIIGDRAILAPRTNGISIHVPDYSINSTENKCDWFDVPCHLSNYDSIEILEGPQLISHGQEHLYQELEHIYLKHFLNHESDFRHYDQEMEYDHGRT